MDTKTEIVDDKIEVLLEVQSIESSEDPPIEDWASLDLWRNEEEMNAKRIAFEAGKHHPGSGQLCAKYLPLSTSSIHRHHYYKYPCVNDPGIKSALADPIPSVIYPLDGQELYLSLCHEMKQCPVKMFHKGLLNSTIDLSYYYVNPMGVSAMAMALENNYFVKILNFTDNFLSDDACFHLGEMLSINNTIEELDLTGCRIKATGVLRLLSGLVTFTGKQAIRNNTLRVLRLGRNELGDDGGENVAKALLRKMCVKELYMSYNNLGSRTAGAMAQAFDLNNHLTHLDFSWNNLYSPLGTCQLLNRLQENDYLKKLNLSWNCMSGPRISAAVSTVLLAPHIQHLDLSNNKFAGADITSIASNLPKATKLTTLNLSSNPMSKIDALNLLNTIRNPTVKIKHLHMDNVVVDEQFINALHEIKAMKPRKLLKITHGEVSGNFVTVGPDKRDLVLNRVDFICSKTKKNKVDIALLVLQLEKDKNEIIDSKYLNGLLKEFGVVLDDGLVEELSCLFPGPVSKKKAQFMNIYLMAEYIRRKWPERRLPPTPPPEAEREPHRKKGKKK